MSGTLVRIGLGLSLSAFVTAGFFSTTAIAQPPNACTYTNSSTGASATYCGPCSNDTAGVTSTAVFVSECGIANNNPRKKQKRAPKQEQPKIEGDGGGGDSNPGEGDATPPK